MDKYPILKLIKIIKIIASKFGTIMVIYSTVKVTHFEIGECFYELDPHVEQIESQD